MKRRSKYREKNIVKPNNNFNVIDTKDVCPSCTSRGVKSNMTKEVKFIHTELGEEMEEILECGICFHQEHVI